MGLGPKGSSLLNKLGFKQAWQMSETELRGIVERDRNRRIIQRGIGRMVAMATRGKRQQRNATPHSASVGPITLESLGLAPALITGLRKSGKSDSQIIKSMREKGLL